MISVISIAVAGVVGAVKWFFFPSLEDQYNIAVQINSEDFSTGDN